MEEPLKKSPNKLLEGITGAIFYETLHECVDKPLNNSSKFIKQSLVGLLDKFVVRSLIEIPSRISGETHEQARLYPWQKFLINPC